MFNHTAKLSRRIAAAAAAGALLVTLPLAGCSDTKKDSGESKTSQSAKAESKKSDSVVVSSKHYKLSGAITEYLLNFLYERFCSTYGTSYFDTSKSLKEQVFDEEKGTTWYDYFVDYTKSYIEQTMTFAEAAQSAKFKLTDDDQSTLDEGFANMSSIAAQESLDVDGYIKEHYGEGITRDDIEAIQKMTLLAQNYSNNLYDNFEYKDKEYEDYYKEHKTDYLYADYMSYAFSFTQENDEGSTITDESKKKDMKETADALAECKSKEEFESFVESYLRENPSLVTVSTESSEASITEDDFNHALEHAVEDLTVKKFKWSDTSDFAKWMFEDDRAEGDTTVIEGDGTYTVYFALKTAYRDESYYKNVRHILISISDDVTEEQAEEKAYEIYKEWKNGVRDEESFAELAEKYSEDPGSQSNGGLYEDVYEGKMVTEFNDWLFDSKREVGDTDVVKTSYGYHIMYFSGNSKLPVWKKAVDGALRNESLSKKYDEFKEKYTIKFDDDAMKKMEIDIEESSAATDADAASGSEAS